MSWRYLVSVESWLKSFQWRLTQRSCFLDMFLFAGAGELVLAQDAGDGVMAAGQVKLVVEAFGAEAGLAAQFDDLALQTRGDLVGTTWGAAAEFCQ